MAHSPNNKQYSKQYYQKHKDEYRKRLTRWRQDNPEKFLEQQRKRKSRYPHLPAIYARVYYAARKGIIKKKSCVVCGSSESQAHHKDYDKPLEVKWLCPKHHAEEHCRPRERLVNSVQRY